MKNRGFAKILLLSLILLMGALSACGNGNDSPKNEPDKGAGTLKGDAQKAGTTGESAGKEETKGTEANKGKKVTLVFSTFWPDDTLKLAKQKYEAKHPNIKIDLQYVESDDEHTEAELEKYVTATNTAMLSGKGPDLLALDMLPAEKYIGQHLLADLSGWLEQDPSFKQGDYFNNILENSKMNGSLYGMPLAFFLNVLIGDEGAIKETGVQIDDKSWTWESFAETVKQLAGKGNNKTGFGSDPKGLLGEMVKENGTQFVDEEKRQASFNSAAFTDMMQQVKQMFDDGVISMERGKPYFKPQNINSAWDYLVSLREYGEQAKLYAKPRAAGAAAGGYFYTYKTIGINEKSAFKEEAWDFLRFLMSEELQPPPQRAGFPINKKVYGKQVQQLFKEGTVKAYEEGPLKGLAFPVDAAKLKQLEGYLNEAVHRAPFQSSKVEDIVSKESEAYFSGQKSAEAVAKLIQNKVTTYLNE